MSLGYSFRDHPIRVEEEEMDSWDLKKWRKRLGYNQFQAAEQLGVGRNTIQNWESARPIPYSVELACIELTRRWKQRREFGPVLLVYADGLVRQHPTDANRSCLLHCEPHPTNEAAMRQILRLSGGPGLLDPLLMFILGEEGEIIWAGTELLHECERQRAERRKSGRLPKTASGVTAEPGLSTRRRKRGKPEPNPWWLRYLAADVHEEQKK
jgi:DNA-binding XRE family transcriptional regulator